MNSHQREIIAHTTHSFDIRRDIAKDEWQLHTYGRDELYNLLSEWEVALEEPHGNDVEGQRHNVVIKLEWVGVGNGNGKHTLVLTLDKA